MNQININQAKTQLSRLIERVAGGEEIIIAKSGKPIARLVPYAPKGAVRRPGAMRGKIASRRTSTNLFQKRSWLRSRISPRLCGCFSIRMSFSSGWDNRKLGKTARRQEQII
jgi:prevent-host-death family protein